MSMRKLLLGLPVVAAALGGMAVTPTPALADNDHTPPWSQPWRHDQDPQGHRADGHPWRGHAEDGGRPQWNGDGRQWADAGHGRDDHRWTDARHDQGGYRHTDGRDRHPAPWWALRPWWSHP